MKLEVNYRRKTGNFLSINANMFVYRWGKDKQINMWVESI